jgi:hypothetical protein
MKAKKKNKLKSDNGIMQQDIGKGFKMKDFLKPIPLFVNGKQVKVVSPLNVDCFYKIDKKKVKN